MDRDYDGPERRDPSCVSARLARVERALADAASTSSGNAQKLGRIETAIFAETDDNEFGRPGLLVTARRLDAHMDTMCKLASLLKTGAITVVSICAGVVTIGKTLGWFE